VIDFRYFTDPEGYDEIMLLAGIKLARKIADQPGLKDGSNENWLLDERYKTIKIFLNMRSAAQIRSITPRPPAKWGIVAIHWQWLIRNCASKAFTA